jgi:hypothetical protein
MEKYILSLFPVGNDLQNITCEAENDLGTSAKTLQITGTTRTVKRFNFPPILSTVN